jgi:hypothetical protein
MSDAVENAQRMHRKAALLVRNVVDLADTLANTMEQVAAMREGLATRDLARTDEHQEAAREARELADRGRRGQDRRETSGDDTAFGPSASC